MGTSGTMRDFTPRGSFGRKRSETKAGFAGTSAPHPGPLPRGEGAEVALSAPLREREEEKRGRPKPPPRETEVRNLEGDLESRPEEARRNAGRRLPVVHVVRAGGRCRSRACDLADRIGLSGLDTGLAIERAALGRHEIAEDVEALVDARDRLAVDQVEDV